MLPLVALLLGVAPPLTHAAKPPARRPAALRSLFRPRRVVLQGFLSLGLLRGCPAWGGSDGVRVEGGVGEGGVVGGFKSIGAAVAAATEGSVVRVPAGVYRERLVLDKPITLVAADDDGPVEIVHTTTAPYENTILAMAPSGKTVTIQGIKIRHNSPSVASNYAVRVDSGRLRLVKCEVSSETGTGVGTEGGSVSLESSNVMACARHGVALFPGLDALSASTPKSIILGCEIKNNGLSGVYVRGADQEATISRCEIANNRQYGVAASGGGLLNVDGCTKLKSNGKGAVQEEQGGSVDIYKECAQQ